MAWPMLHTNPCFFVGVSFFSKWGAIMSRTNKKIRNKKI